MYRRALIVFSALLLYTGVAHADRGDGEGLPDLGDVSASPYSVQQEHQLGRAWLMMFRAQADTLTDPLLQDYVENLLYRLAANSELKDRRLETVLVDNNTINAFAVPGGVIGVHSGLFLSADNEAQFGGVLAHELAHLSQRHFSRSLDKAREATLPTLAGLLAGVILAATTHSDAGIAAITASQAAALENRLRFSRQHEQEADRIGMETLAKSNMDPNGIPSMFENMNERVRYARSKPPEFLLTHPLTDSRISDSKNRARQYPRQVYTDNLNFQLMRARVAVHHSNKPEDLLSRWEDTQGPNGEAHRYGRTLALLKLERWADARASLAVLLAEDPGRIAYQCAQGRLLMGEKRYREAIEFLRSRLALSPDNYPLTMLLADALQQAGQVNDADDLLTDFSDVRPDDPALWYQLAEVRGLARNILGVHRARAEYFILVGQFERASAQLRYAYRLTGDNAVLQGRIRQRLRDIDELKKRIEEL